ncbi:hypothetical protein L596_005364 [Steinernema carpocapsae]|uniref:Uncharacterized protein n=1 Tax=Steinernema carpocapsae TaxID=34508 RepID=A0A4U8UYW1_STECR|nr:hypothetical protein L596_005364 [Steinernema carpocapsae]
MTHTRQRGKRPLEGGRSLLVLTTGTCEALRLEKLYIKKGKRTRIRAYEEVEIRLHRTDLDSTRKKLRMCVSTCGKSKKKRLL